MNPSRQAVVDIHVTTHARERARERCPGFKAARIVDEVRASLREGRISPRQPGWVYGNRQEDCLYVWTPEHERCYPIKATISGFIVLTTMTPRAA